MSECITSNNGDYKKPSWNYLLKTFVNVCGKCGKKQMKFQQMENKLLEMEKQRMEMFMNFEDEDGEEYDEEYKEQFGKMTDEEIERHIGLEQVRNVMEGFEREHGIDKIRWMIQEVRNEDKKEEPDDEEYESDSSETQRMKRLQWIRDNRKPKNWKRPLKTLKEKMTIYNKRKLSKVFRAKNIQELEGENMGLYVDFGSESEDEAIRDFVRCHPMPSPDDKEGEQFWKQVIDRMKEA